VQVVNGVAKEPNRNNSSLRGSLIFKSQTKGTMKTNKFLTRLRRTFAITGTLLFTSRSVDAQNVLEREARDIARDAYIYAYPLVLTFILLAHGQHL